MPENEGPGQQEQRGFRSHPWLWSAAGAGLLALIVLLYNVCGVDPPEEFGTTGSDIGIVESESPEDSNELEPSGTGPVPTGTATGTAGPESPFDFAVLDGTYHLVFTDGTGNCGFAERFEDDFDFLIQGARIFIEQAGTGQSTQGRFDPDTKRFETRGRTSGHVEIFQGRFNTGDRFRGNYSIFQDCDQHWELRGEMRRG